MRIRWKLAAVMSAVALGAGVAVAQAAGAPDPGACLDSEEAAFLELINDYRAENDVPALKVSETLNTASFLHSQDMADNDYFDHDSQDGRTPQDRMDDAGYDTDTSTGENIAAGYPTADEAFETWRESEGHNENMLDEDFAVIGIGLAENEDSEYGQYWTTDFGGEIDAAPDCGD